MIKPVHLHAVAIAFFLAFYAMFASLGKFQKFPKETETFSDQDAKRFDQLAKQNGTWLIPLLMTMLWIASQDCFCRDHHLT